MTITPVTRPSVDDASGVRTISSDAAAYDSWPGMASSGDLGSVPQSYEPTAIPYSLEDATTRQLRRWINQLYRLLDTAMPPFGAQADCERLAEELERREVQARQVSATSHRNTFRDNPMNHRFELFQDGDLAAYVSYSMRAGSLRLHRTVVAEAFEGADLEAVLIRKVLLDSHKRRLAALPYCQKVQAFLAGNPQYKTLLAG